MYEIAEAGPEMVGAFDKAVLTDRATTDGWSYWESGSAQSWERVAQLTLRLTILDPDGSGTRWATDGTRRILRRKVTRATLAIFVCRCDSRVKIHVPVHAQKQREKKRKKKSATRRVGR